MKHLLSKTILSLLLFLAAFSFNAMAQQAIDSRPESSGEIKQDLKALEQLLNSDGTINRNAKATGSFDVSSYDMSYGANGEPVFTQKAKASSASDDGSWSDQFPGPPGTDGYVNAIVKDASNNIIIGGSFTNIAGVAANNIAKWDGTAWSALGTGMNGSVYALAIDGSGTVYAGGTFSSAGGVANTYCIAKWNGTAWTALGTGLNGAVYELAIDESDNVYAGGEFTTAGGVANTKYIAKWNGTVWSALGTGLNGAVYALAIDESDNVYAGGTFTSAGGVASTYCIAKWNGAAWSALGSGMNNSVLSLAIDGSGNVFAGGNFNVAGSNYIAKWNGAAWSALGTGMNGIVYSLAIDGSGNVYAGGDFTTAGGVPANRIAKWNGNAWSALGTGMNYWVFALAIDGSGNVYAGGKFTAAGGVAANYIAKWNDTVWSAWGLNKGMNNTVSALAIDGSGNVYAGGTFTAAGGVANTNYIAKWNGTVWSALGNGMNDWVYSLVIDRSGNVYAGGEFTTASGVYVDRIAKWDGTAWSALGTGMDGSVSALAIDGSGNVYAGGTFTTAGGMANTNYIAKWDDTAWSALGTGMNNPVYALSIDGSDNVYAGGSFTNADGVPANKISKWDGTAWSALGIGMNSTVYSLAIDGSDNVYAGGGFTNAGGVPASKIAKWNGTAWSALGTGMNNTIRSLAIDGNGNVYAGGSFTTAGGVSVNRIAKWNGTAWSALGTGMDNSVHALAIDGSDNVYAGGYFQFADGINSAYFGKYTPFVQVTTDQNASTLGLTSTSVVEVAAGATLTVDANLELSKLILAPTAKVSLGSHTLNAPNGVILQSSADGSATILGDNAISNATVEQYVTAGRNWYISSPISSASYAELSRGVEVVEWNEATKNWDTKSSGTLTRGRGYIQIADAVDPGTTGALSFDGTTNAGNVDVAVTRTESGTGPGFNLVGNPYPSYLNWSSFIAEATNANISRTFWYRTKNTSGGYTFVTYNGVGGTYVTSYGTANTAISGKIPPMQAFWIRVNSGTASSTARFTNAMREHRDADLNKFKAPKVSERASLRLQLKNQTYSDETLVYFDANAANAFDNYDSPKMTNENDELPELYTKAGSERLVINGLNALTDNMELPLGFSLKASASLSFKVSEMANFGSGTRIYLLDKQEKSQTELYPETEYSFSTKTTTTNNENRFSLLFRAPGISTEVDKAGEQTVNVFVDATNQLIVSAPLNSSYAIYNTIGQLMENGAITSNSQTSNFKHAAGVYIVKVLKNGKELTSRIIIK